MLRRLQNFTIDWRVGDTKTTGKIAARNAVFNQLQSFIAVNASELYQPVFIDPWSTSPMDKVNAKIAVMQVCVFFEP